MPSFRRLLRGNALRLGALALLVMLIGACGNKGPLVKPTPPAAPPTTPVPTPAQPAIEPPVH